jgi:hypothetical protein
LGDKIEKNQLGGSCRTYGGEEMYIQGFGGESEVKRQLGRPRHRWEGNIKLDLQEVGLGVMDWIDLAQDREGGGHL